MSTLNQATVRSAGVTLDLADELDTLVLAVDLDPAKDLLADFGARLAHWRHQP
jgi:hypothetical protein